MLRHDRSRAEELLSSARDEFCAHFLDRCIECFGALFGSCRLKYKVETKSLQVDLGELAERLFEADFHGSASVVTVPLEPRTLSLWSAGSTYMTKPVAGFVVGAVVASAIPITPDPPPNALVALSN